jgi:hypothetical protein
VAVEVHQTKQQRPAQVAQVEAVLVINILVLLLVLEEQIQVVEAVDLGLLLVEAVDLEL